MDVSWGVERGTPDSDLTKGLVGLPKDNMFGLVGPQLSGFLQWEHLYGALRYINTSQFLPLGDRPVIANSDYSGLIGVAFPAFSRSSIWSLSLATGAGINWGVKRGPLISEGFLSKTYEEKTYSTPSFALEAKVSSRFLNHIGFGLKYSSSINREFSSNMISVFFEAFL